MFSDMLSLSAYIAMLGDEEFARRYGVKERTAQAYRLGERKPRPARARAIVEGSDGQLSFASIYDDGAAAPNAPEAPDDPDSRAEPANGGGRDSSSGRRSAVPAGSCTERAA